MRPARSSLVASLLVPALLATSLPAFAADPPLPPAASTPSSASAPASASAAPPLATLPDVVKLKDGSMFRGTILEQVAGSHVELRLASGETRRFAAGDVAYAGEVEAAPAKGATPAPAASPPDGKVKLHLEASEPGIEYEIQTGTAEITGMAWTGRGAAVITGTAKSYAPLCTAPCDTWLPAGTHHLALSRNGHSAVDPDEPVSVSGPSNIDAVYTDRAGTRVAGWLVFLGSLAGGTALILTSRTTSRECTTSSFDGSESCYDVPKIDGTQAALGAGVALVGGLVGIVLAWQKDGAEFRVSPAAVGSATPGVARREGANAGPNGLALSGRF